jgi:hypothetical protein
LRPPRDVADIQWAHRTCPLLALSRHRLVHRTCPLSGVKRTCVALTFGRLSFLSYEPLRGLFIVWPVVDRIFIVDQIRVSPNYLGGFFALRSIEGSN